MAVGEKMKNGDEKGKGNKEKIASITGEKALIFLEYYFG